MAVAISNPTVRVNDETIAVVPNSVAVTDGLGEINVRAASAGGGSIVSVHTVDAEGKVGMVSFEVYNTPDILRKISGWKADVGNNTIQIIGNLPSGDSFSQSMQNASLANDPEKELSADGTTSLEFKGDPVTIG